MHVLIVHGFRPKRSGEMHPDFKLRLDKALELDRAEKFDAILITGGKTRSNALPEARQAENYLKSKTSTPLILEANSHSTSENVRFSKEKLTGSSVDKSPHLHKTVSNPREGTISSIHSRSKTAGHSERCGDKAVAIVSTPYLKRTAYLYGAIWPEIKSVLFVTTKSGVTPLAPLREFFYRIYARLDPWERFAPAKIFKKYLRQ